MCCFFEDLAFGILCDIIISTSTVIFVVERLLKLFHVGIKRNELNGFFNRLKVLSTHLLLSDCLLLLLSWPTCVLEKWRCMYLSFDTGPQSQMYCTLFCMTAYLNITTPVNYMYLDYIQSKQFALPRSVTIWFAMGFSLYWRQTLFCSKACTYFLEGK